MNTIPVLYVEDNEHDRALVQHVAELAGTRLKIRCVGGVPEAVDYMRGQGQFNNRVDHSLPVFILLDFHLDNQPGLDFLYWLRTRPEFESLPVCIYTDADFVEPIASSYSAGADAFMLKAGSLTRLQEILRALESCAASTPPSFKSLVGLPEHRTAPREHRLKARDQPKHQSMEPIKSTELLVHHIRQAGSTIGPRKLGLFKLALALRGTTNLRAQEETVDTTV